MPADRNLAEVELEWIAKYRAALNSVPVEQPRGFLSLLRSAKDAVLTKISKLFTNNRREASCDHVLEIRPKAAPAPRMAAATEKKIRKQPKHVSPGGEAGLKRVSGELN